MKIYTYLKKPSDIVRNDPNLPLDVKYSLYAITTNKEHSKLFKKTRNMDLFIQRTIEVDTKEDAEKYMKNHRGQVLTKGYIRGVKDKNLDTQRPFFAYVLYTENEINFTMECTDSGQVLNYISSYIPIEIFSDRVREALYTLKYHKAASVVYGRTVASIDVEHPIDDFLDIEMSFDMFGVFILLYQDTFSENFFNYVEITDEAPDDMPPWM